MQGDQVPAQDHVSRLARPSDCTDGGRVTASAFELRVDRNEKYLSVNWLEFLNLPTREAEINEIRSVLGEKLKLGKAARIAVLRVRTITQEGLRVIHEPSEQPPDPSHTGIYGLDLVPADQEFFIRTSLANGVEVAYSART